MKFLLTLFFAALPAVVVSGFSPALTTQRAAATITTSTSLAFFGGKKPAKKQDPNKQDADVFAGKGKKITVRQDEDNAMWIEEDKKTGERKKPSKKGVSVAKKHQIHEHVSFCTILTFLALLTVVWKLN
jgi:hypothetical protein